MGRRSVGSKIVQKPIGAVFGLLAALLTGSFVVGEQVAHAADARTEKAREHYLQADALYKLDRYANALAEYEQAYIAKPDPSFLYNIAQCHRLMGNRSEAVKFYRRYLKDAPSAPNREVADKHIKDLEASLIVSPEDPHARPVTSPSLPSPTPSPMPPPAPTTVGTSGTGAAPSGRALALNAPPPPPDASLTANGGSSVPPSSDDDRPIYTKWWFLTGVGAVVVGGVVLLLVSGGDPSCPAGRTCR
jgi:tetratricopeptide (TPR) repeat protein